MRRLPAVLLCVSALLIGLAPALAQSLKPAAPYTVISRDGRRAIQAVSAGDQDMLRLEDVASVFQMTIREARSSNSLTVTRAGRTVVLSLDQALASVSGRLVSLAATPVRDGSRWVVPADFVSRALPLVMDVRIELRRPPRLILVGDVRVPRVTAKLEQTGGATRVTMDVSPAAPYTVSQEPRRLVIRFESEGLDVASTPAAGQGLVESITALDDRAMAIALAPAFGTFRSSSVAIDAGSTRLVIDVLPAGAPAPPPPAPLRPPPPAAPAPAPAGRVDPAPALPAAAAPIRTIVLDPGHGGEEIGARGVSGAMEKDITLDVAARLKSALEARLGLRVLLTRDDDKLVPLDDRAAMANNNKADLFISLHVNASPRKDARGAEVFYLSLDGLDAETRKMAEAPKAKPLPVQGGGSREIELILWETAQARYLAESAAFAGLVEEELRKTVEMSQRPIQQAAFRVLVSANMPAVLVEIGFVSNPEQEAQLITDAYKNQIVQALYDAIVRYRARLAGARPDRH